MTKQRNMTRKEFLLASAGLTAVGLSRTPLGITKPTPVPAVPLGKTGLKVSPICYGTGRTQDPFLVKNALDKGITLFDTARSYAGGQNEAMLGGVLKNVRNEVFIQTKIRTRIRRDEQLTKAGIAGMVRRQLDTALKDSLRALQTDTIDILLYHWARSEAQVFHDAVLEFFTAAKKAGKIRACGFSAHNDQMDVLERASREFFYEVVMVPYNYKGSYIHSVSKSYNEWDQDRLEILLQKLHAQGVGILAMKTCSAGPMADGDHEDPSYQNAIRWVLNRPFVDCANVAMGNFDEIEEDISAMRC